MDNLPLITVITPVYNASLFLPRVIACVQEQHLDNYEHILVDDCSKDDSFDVLLRFAAKDKKIKVIQLPKNCGAVMARNAAISVAKGRYLAFLDADDVWMPSKLKIQSMFMLENNAALSFSDYRFISEDGSRIGRLLRGPNRIGWSLHHMTRYLGCLTIMVDRKRCPGFLFPDVSPDDPVEDFLAWSAIINEHKVAVRCPYDLARYAVVHNSRSRSAVKMAKSVWRLYRITEKIPLVSATAYFVVYFLFASIKRYFFRPIWARSKIDNDFYLLD